MIQFREYRSDLEEEFFSLWDAWLHFKKLEFFEALKLIQEHQKYCCMEGFIGFIGEENIFRLKLVCFLLLGDKRKAIKILPLQL